MTRGSLGRYLFVLILLTTAVSFGQSKKVWLYKADEFYDKMDFANAEHYYHKVLDDTLGLSTRVLPYEHVILGYVTNRVTALKSVSETTLHINWQCVTVTATIIRML